jgi:hypothetical protein
VFQKDATDWVVSSVNRKDGKGFKVFGTDQQSASSINKTKSSHWLTGLRSIDGVMG